MENSARTVIINLCGAVALLALIAGLAASILCMGQRIGLDEYKTALDVASLIWFCTAPFWMTPQLLGEKWAEAAKSAWLRKASEK